MFVNFMHGRIFECNIRSCFMAFSSCCKRKIFSMQAQFRVIMRVKGSLLLKKC